MFIITTIIIIMIIMIIIIGIIILFCFFISEIETQKATKFRRRSYSSRDLRQLSDGREIYEALTRASDPDAVKVCETDQ